MSHEEVPNNFLGLAPELTNIEKSKVAVIQAPLETTTSYQHGTSKGPTAFITASQQVELYDIQSKLDFSSIGAVTFEAPKLAGLGNEAALKIIEADVERALEKNLWPIVIGGEHTISLAPVRALKKRFSDLSVLQIDAHADLRESYAGSPFSHACVMKRVIDLGVPVTGVGIRNYSREEAEFIPGSKYTVFHDHDIVKNGLDPALIAKSLSKNVYITVDIDGFTPEECPGTGTPEPGGITWWHAMKLFKYIFSTFNVVGMDINEIMPLSSSARTEFFAAKLAYKMMGMKFFPKQCCVE